jgi:hypothetical protein
MMLAGTDISAKRRDPGDTRHSLTGDSRTKNISRTADAQREKTHSLSWIEIPPIRGVTIHDNWASFF